MGLKFAPRGAAVGYGLFAAAALAQSEAPPPAADAEHDLAKQLSNPVASLISVPFQENVDFGLGPDGDGVKSVLNIQPVVPVSIAPEWNLIIRTILPLVYQDDVTAPGVDQSGTGDITQSFFFSPAKPGANGIIWAVGPALLYPTATNNALGGEKWGAGPTGLILKQAGKNTFGILANHIWSYAGDGGRSDISATFLQPFFSYIDGPTTYGINMEASYDWEHDQWVAPVNLTVTRLVKVGSQRLSVGGGVRYYFDKPEGGPDWGLRLIVTFLFPKGG